MEDEYAGRGSAPARVRHQKQNDFAELLLENSEFGKFRDSQIEGYLPFLEREITRLNGGQIARCYLRAVQRNYREFHWSQGHPAARYIAWLSIQATCRFLVQLGRTAL